MSPAPTMRTTTERYQRAASFLPQNILHQLSGQVLQGYWIDDHRYFFLVTDIVGGRQRCVPSIADAHTGSVEPVLPLEVLAEQIAATSGKDVAAIDLAPARYEMPDATTLVVILNPEAYRIKLDGPLKVEASTLELTPWLLSPDSQHAAFLDGHDVWVKNLCSDVASPVTTDGERHHAYGVDPESGIAPMASRESRLPVGMWSPDSQWFLTHRIDERHLPDGGLIEHAPKGGGRPIAHAFKVSRPDDDLPTCEFIAYHAASGKVVRSGDVKVGISGFSPFTFRQSWITTEHVYFFDWDRFASKVSLMAMSLTSSQIATIFTEAAESGWIDLNPHVVGQPMVRPLQATGELIWYSQLDGRGHLYLHELDGGALKNRITEGDWVVRELVHVDEVQRRILFLASGFKDDEDLGHRRLCTVNFDGSGFKSLVRAEGDLYIKPEPVTGCDAPRPFGPPRMSGGLSRNGRFGAACISSTTIPTRWLLIDIEKGQRNEIARVDIDVQLQAPKPQHFEALAADGKTKLFGAMYFPSDFDPSKSYPLMDYIYPGPQVNWYQRRFPSTMSLALQSIIELGMVGVIFETRGMPNRGRAFHQAGKGQLLEPQLSDHAAVIEQLCRRHRFLDGTRIGIFGQSGGGHATARALFDYPAIFKVGVAVCGNHDNRNYIAHWINKYGGRPGTAERDEQANVGAAHKLQGKLMLMHGDMDDNVHPGHTLALSAALIAAGKDFDQLIVPGATHALLSESPYAMQRLWDYLTRHLLNRDPPKDFRLSWTPAGVALVRLMQANDTV